MKTAICTRIIHLAAIIFGVQLIGWAIDWLPQNLTSAMDAFISQDIYSASLCLVGIWALLLIVQTQINTKWVQTKLGAVWTRFLQFEIEVLGFFIDLFVTIAFALAYKSGDAYFFGTALALSISVLGLSLWTELNLKREVTSDHLHPMLGKWNNRCVHTLNKFLGTDISEANLGLTFVVLAVLVLLVVLWL
ncbi:hypothetical protein LCGC14_0282450 [marine sediment metagenome]|uniref:Uncharacterized protein n=1 Tax=marine sediment metagenome TaxID=412755 RepID=A0A0F9WGP9_9ZZZZ